MKRTTLRGNRDPWRIQNDAMTYSDGSVVGLQAGLNESWKQVEGDDSKQGIVYWSKQVAGTQRVDHASVPIKLGHYQIILWWIGQTPMARYLASGATITESPLSDGTVRIVAKGPYGEAILEASPSDGWLPRKFRITKRLDDLCIDGTVRQWLAPEPQSPTVTDVYPPGEEPERQPPPPTVQSITWEGTAEGFTSDDQGRWFARRISVTQTIHYQGRPPAVLTATVDIDSLKFDPKFTADDFRSDLVFPVNAAVTVRGAEHLPFKWDGTKPVPGIPARQPLAKSSAPPLAAAGQGMSVWLVGVNVLLILALAWLVIRHRYSQR